MNQVLIAFESFHVSVYNSSESITFLTGLPVNGQIKTVPSILKYVV